MFFQLTFLLFVLCFWLTPLSSTFTHRFWNNNIFRYKRPLSHGKTKLGAFCSKTASPLNYGIDLGTRHISSPDGSLRIAVVGDWGVLNQTVLAESTNYETPYRIGDAISTYHRIHPDLAFVINGGDNFYDVGVNSVSNPRWNNTFNEPFNNISLYFYSVLGNHDWKGNRDAFRQNPTDPSIWDQSTVAQIEFTTSTMFNFVKNWCMPNYYYTFSYEITPKERYWSWYKQSLKVRFVALDSHSLLRYEHNGCQPNATGGISDYCQGSSSPNPLTQLNWLEDVLRESRHYDYVVVFSHYFLVSRSEHGLKLNTPVKNPITGEQQCVRSDAFGGYPTMRVNVTNLLAKYDNVQLYLAGHGHASEAFQGSTRGKGCHTVLQTVIGRAGRTDSVICGDQKDIDRQYNLNDADGRSDILWDVQYGSSIPTFGTVVFRKQSLTVEIRDTIQNVLWSKSLKKTGKSRGE